MNILFITPYIPFPMNRGAKLRTASLLYAFKDHDVTLLGLHQGEQIDEAKLEKYTSRYEVFSHRNPLADSKWNKVAGWIWATIRLLPTPVYSENNTGLHRAIEQLSKRKTFDYVVVEFPWLMQYAMRFRGKSKIILDCHNLESDGFKKSHKFYWLPVWWIWRNYERWSAKYADIVLVTSEVEKERFTQLYPQGSYIVVPNSIDVKAYTRSEYKDRKHIVFTGSLDYLPNIQAVELLVHDVYPIIRKNNPDVQLNIVGFNPSPKILAYGKYPGINVYANVPDIEPYISSAKLSIVPITSGAGTRLKILEAFALGTPVVSTSFGAEGVDVTDEKDVLLSSDIAGLAHKIIILLGDEVLGRKLVSNGRKLVEDKYSWQRVGQVVGEVLSK